MKDKDIQQQFKIYVDSTGNNHNLVRQILKKRTWLFQVEKIKSNNNFYQANFIWTQWRKNSIACKLAPHQIYSKIDGNYFLTNKNNLSDTMK